MDRFFRALITSRALWIAAAAVALALHLAWARNTHGANLERCGALWAVFGAAMLARPIICQRFDDWFRLAQGADGGGYADAADPDAVARQVEADRAAEAAARADAQAQQILGPALIVAGTILWGYGDLLGHWLFACRCR